MAKGPEQLPQNPERSVESKSVENKYELYEKPETAAEIASIESVERLEKRARTEAMETAVSVERKGMEQKRPGESTKASARRAASKQAKEASFKRQMGRIQTEMKPTERAFSKFIHNKTVEKMSDAVGATIARPNAILSGAIMAFVAVLVVYIVAKNLGYVLSGFETIGAFIVGWIIGVVYDYLRLIITGKK
ncbi:MAG TPA: hypothetical protein PLY16_00745 [Candidatus Saccharibacteria bacterium]|nr:hypothetical protein [Candidatus Saccharibacteria bacterium]